MVWTGHVVDRFMLSLRIWSRSLILLLDLQWHEQPNSREARTSCSDATQQISETDERPCEGFLLGP